MYITFKVIGNVGAQRGSVYENFVFFTDILPSATCKQIFEIVHRNTEIPIEQIILIRHGRSWLEYKDDPISAEIFEELKHTNCIQVCRKETRQKKKIRKVKKWFTKVKHFFW